MTRQNAARTAIPFRSVNLRGTPGYDPALQRHHLLPRQVLSNACFRTMFEAIGGSRVRFEDFRTNGMLLPAQEERAARLNLPLHRGPHRQYNAMVMERIGRIEHGWSAKRAKCDERASEDALMRLGLLQSALKRRLLATLGRRLVLNRRDPGGAPVDFSDLDAMADALWGATDDAAPDLLGSPEAA